MKDNEKVGNAEWAAALRIMTKRVGVALTGQRDKGAVRSDQGPGQYMLWEIAR